MSERQENEKVTIQLDEVKDQIIESIGGVSIIEINGLHMQCTPNALDKTFDHIFAEANRILKVASGIATIKGYSTVTKTEVDQAIKMVQEGVGKYLPEEPEDW